MFSFKSCESCSLNAESSKICCLTFFVYDSEVLKDKVKQNVRNAFKQEEQRTRQFGSSQSRPMPLSPTLMPTAQPEEERPQPDIFTGTLKHYQLKGMNWLANLYDQVISLHFINYSVSSVI